MDWIVRHPWMAVAAGIVLLALANGLDQLMTP